jgi:hypothetical protein
MLREKPGFRAAIEHARAGGAYDVLAAARKKALDGAVGAARMLLERYERDD